MSQYNQTENVFRPVKTTEDKLASLDTINGYLYFTTDTQKVFLGHNNEKLEMCASKGFYYGKKLVEYENNGSDPNPEVQFIYSENEDASEIEGASIPEVDDLILNVGTESITDGCFYRVTNVEPDEDYTILNTTRLTLQGSGSGGSGSGGGSATNTFVVTATSKTCYFSTSATEALIGFKASSSDSNNYIDYVAWGFASSETELKENYVEEYNNLSVPMQKTYNIDLVKYLSKFDPNTATPVTVIIRDSQGIQRSLTYKIYSITLTLTKASADLLALTNDSDLTFVSSISQASLSQKKINYRFFTANSDIPVYEMSTNLQDNDSGEISITFGDDVRNALSHGEYELQIYANGYKNGSYVESNTLIHKILRYDLTGKPLLGALVPSEIEQYTDFDISVLLAGDINKTYSLEIGYKKPGMSVITKLSSIEITTNQVQTITLPQFYQTGYYALTCVISSLGISQEYEFTVIAYEGTLPVISLERTDLQVYLNPVGKDNTSTDKNKWDSMVNNYSATLSNFFYGNVNGWSTDSNGVKCLKVNQGAKMVLDNYEPFATNALNTGMTIELDFKLSGVTDYATPLISCISRDANKTIQGGFEIFGDAAKFYTTALNDDSKGINLNIVENKRIRLTFKLEKNNQSIPMILTYLNGICSNATSYVASADSVEQSQSNKALFTVDSSAGEVILYSVRFYNTALNEATILNNMQASFATKEEKEAEYLDNLILDDQGKISLDLFRADSYNPKIPYILITGGQTCDKEFKLSATLTEPVLPTGKKEYKLINFELHYPKDMSLFNEYEDFNTRCVFADSSKTVFTAYGEAPVSGGAMMYGQGTSSMEYPVKNLRIKFQDKKIKVSPKIDAVDLICLKADYMESSGSHNTGSGNLIDATYASIPSTSTKSGYMQTPGQETFATDNREIVTCIKGHPCIVFYSNDGKNYEFIGKYNLNLDKATPEPFGFMYGDGDFNDIHCFEFLDNNVEICNFEGENYGNTWYDTYMDGTTEKFKWQQGFESRFPEDLEGKNDADSLREVAMWINEVYCTDYKQGIADGYTTNDVTYNYNQIEANGKTDSEITAMYSATTKYYQLQNDQYVEVAIGGYEQGDSGYTDDYINEDFVSAVKAGLYTRDDNSKRFANKGLERFRREYQCYFDKDFLLAYYIITNTLLMVDSRVKNLMFATWGKETSSYLDLNDERHEITKYKWYPIFYDMDTMLGVNNQGKPVYAYDVDDEPQQEGGVFNGKGYLWRLVKEALSSEVAEMYNKMETSNNAWTVNSILPKFNDNQANMANEAIYNGDAAYKYIEKYRTGYHDYLYNRDWGPGEAPYLYAAQGSRDLDREYFITNRVHLLAGKYQSSYFLNSDRLKFRLNYPKKASDKVTAASIKAVPPDGVFTLTGFKTGYSGVKVGQNGTPYQIQFDKADLQPQTLNINTSGAGNTETYILGISNLSDMGDLSAKYPENLIFDRDTNGEVKLTKLKIGNDHKDYKNGYWTEELKLTGFKKLEELDITNCSGYSRNLDLSDCAQIKKILASGTNVSTLILPVGGVLQELRLPATLSTLTIQSQTHLTFDNFSMGEYIASDEYPRISDGKGVWNNSFDKIKTLDIEEMPEFDSYTIVMNAPLLEKYYLTNVNWTITKIDGLDESGKITEIPILEFLKEKAPLKDTAGKALTGIITLAVPGATANEYELYQKYNIKAGFENLKIVCDKEIMGDIEPAFEINFYNALQYSEGLESYYQALSDGSADLATLTTNLIAPSYPPSAEYTYAFANQWQIVASEDSTLQVETIINVNDFATIKPTKTISLIPVYTPIPRVYTLTLYDDSTPAQEIKTFELRYQDDNTVVYGKKLLEVIEAIDHDNLYQLSYQYAESAQGGHYRKTFKGWQNATQRNENSDEVAWTDFSDTIITGNIIAYAYFKEEDARTIPMDNRYFNFKGSTTANNIPENGPVISIKEMYRDKLQGNITLPKQNPNGEDIYYIGDFNDIINVETVYTLADSKYRGIVEKGFVMTKPNKLNHVYLQKNEEFTYIGQEAFQNCYNLEGLYLDSSTELNDYITYIGMSAFRYASAAIMGSPADSMCIAISSLPSNLTTLGSSAFFKGGNNITISSLPNHLQQINTWTFSYCSNLNISQFGSSDEDLIPYCLQTIDAAAFAYAGKNVSEITIGKSITTIYESRDSMPLPFKNYGTNSLIINAESKAATDIYKNSNNETWASYIDMGFSGQSTIATI